jgi:hypothetical protein
LAAFEIEQKARTLRVRDDEEVVLELELQPPATLAINRYTARTAAGVIFVGRRNIADPLTSTESVKSLIEFQSNSGSRETFVNCAFKGSVGLNLCVTSTGLEMRNEAVRETGET